MGRCGVWVRQDGHGYLVDRIVKKDVRILAMQTWNDITLWAGRSKFAPLPEHGMDVIRLDRRAPKEAHIHEMLTQRQPDNVVEFRGASTVDSAQQRFRILVALAAHGDLYDLIEKHRVKKTSFPEPFIWYTLFCLVNECTNMSRVDIQEDLDIVHRDLKPKNVVLDVADPDLFPAYPVAKVIDFGLAVDTNEDDPLNPRFYTDWGAPGFMAPEHVSWLNRDTSDFEPFERLGMWTNVYAVGVIIW